jgi:L-threonylcarbamoyladenylate synthase
VPSIICLRKGTAGATTPHNGEMAETERLPLSEFDLQNKSAAPTIERVAAIWRGGGTVAFPTETVYGLGANAFDAKAVEGIFAAKQRPAWDPVIVHVSDGLPLGRLVAEVSDTARALMEAFWPGPLTLLLPRGPDVPDVVTAGRPLVGVRVPAHPVARALISAAGMPIAAPSANSFGRPSPTTAAHVLEDLDGRIDAVVDGGPTRHGVESTVVDASQSPIIVYRPGAVTLEALRGVVGEVKLYEGAGLEPGEEPSGLPSPGVGSRHYAPRARMVLVETQEAGDEEAVVGFRLFHAVAKLRREGNGVRVGVMAPEEFKSDVRAADAIFGWGRWGDLESLAQRLFAGLRWLDTQEATHIVCPLPAERGIGRALRDRLEKAARLPLVKS